LDTFENFIVGAKNFAAGYVGASGSGWGMGICHIEFCKAKSQLKRQGNKMCIKIKIESIVNCYE
jgi:hypothetical protein